MRSSASRAAPPIPRTSPPPECSTRACCAARIRMLDLSKAQALPGVKVILTRENCDLTWASGDTRNKRYLFNNPVRFAGDAVAAVAAVDRHVAEEACRLIDVDYETLPFVLEPEEALKAGAPEIQPGGNLSANNQ